MNEREIKLYNQGYLAGHHDTVESIFTDIFQGDMSTYQADVVLDLLKYEPAPTCHWAAEGPDGIIKVFIGDDAEEEAKDLAYDYNTDEDTCGMCVRVARVEVRKVE